MTTITDLRTADRVDCIVAHPMPYHNYAKKTQRTPAEYVSDVTRNLQSSANLAAAKTIILCVDDERENPHDATCASPLLALSWRMAIAMQDAGWFLRLNIPYLLGGSVEDKPPRQIFVFSRDSDVYYESGNLDGVESMSYTDALSLLVISTCPSGGGVLDFYPSSNVVSQAVEKVKDINYVKLAKKK